MKNSGFPQLKMTSIGSGRAVYVQPDGTLYVGRNYDILSSCDHGLTWTRTVSMPRSMMRRTLAISRLACRLLRHEVRALVVMEDGTHVAANREGIFYAARDETMMHQCEVESSGESLMPPMCITLGPEGRVLWGEYFSNVQRREVRLCASDDGGKNFTVARVFEPGEVRHIHNIVYDKHLAHYWILSGDYGSEAGIGRLSKDLKDFDWVVKGEQIYRVVCVFDLGDRLIYGTDTELEPNAVMSLDKKSGRVERVFELDGSCIYACRFGKLYILSTTVEPSSVNRARSATLWLSRDGEEWIRVLQAPKDRWHEKYFQYGSFVLPRGESDDETVFFSGQALEGVDGRAIVANVQNELGDGGIAALGDPRSDKSTTP